MPMMQQDGAPEQLLQGAQMVHHRILQPSKGMQVAGLNAGGGRSDSWWPRHKHDGIACGIHPEHGYLCLS